MRSISKELEKHLKRGFSERNLFYARKFYEIYGNSKIDVRLSWSHYRILSSIANANLREKLMKEAIEGNWNRDDLSYRVRDIGELRKAPTLRWRRPEGVLWNYKIKDISKEKGTLLIDLGFYCYYELPKSRLNQYKTGDIIQIEKQNGIWSLSKSKLDSELYFYFGEIERVIDGDTILVKFELGFNVITRQRIRLHNVWSAELGSSEGEDNFESLKKKLPLKTKVIVRSRSKDVYGRFVGEVLYSKKKIQHPEDIFTIGIYLNQELAEIS
ncbi:PF06250 domain protein [Leptospira kirschneri serovar Bulgarica str. Nikolaevo]|nr:PF06250 domain protein [Leptospira kirschneri serovar Bulgarica str. Nikolaevo]